MRFENRRNDGISRLTTSVVARTLVFLLVGTPLVLMLLAGLRGPAHILPFEPGGTWTLANFTYFYRDSSLYQTLLPDTLVFAVGSSIGAFTIGLFLAYVVECWQIRRKAALVTIFILPLAFPTPSIALAWIQVLGPNSGLVNQFMRHFGLIDQSDTFVNIFSMPGLMWCQAIATAPFAFLLLRPGLQARNPACEEAAHLCGAGPGTTFWRITVGQVRPLLLAPLVVLLVISVEQVDFPLMLGGGANINVLGTRLLWEFTSPVDLPNFGAICAASLPLVVLSSLSLWAFSRLTKSAQRFEVIGSSAQHQLRPLRGWPKLIIITGSVAYALLCVALPLTSLIFTALRIHIEPSTWTITSSISSLTSIAYDRRIWLALLNSTVLALSVGIITVAIGTSLALSKSNNDGLLGRCAEHLSMMSLGIPSLVVAASTGLIFLLLPWGLYGTLWILVIALCYRLALATSMAIAARTQINPNIIEAAAICGANWMERSTRISIPLMSPSLITTSALLMIVAARELTVPLMLYSPDSAVLPVMMMQLRQSGQEPEAALCGLLLGLVCMLGLTLALNSGKWLDDRHRRTC